MSRATERRLAPNLEGLESRNLQSGLSVGANSQLIGLVPPAQKVVPAPVNQSFHNYQVFTGYFSE